MLIAGKQRWPWLCCVGKGSSFCGFVSVLWRMKKVSRNVYRRVVDEDMHNSATPHWL